MMRASGGSGPSFRRIRSRLQEDQVQASGGSGLGFRRIRSRLQEDQVQASVSSGPGFRKIRSELQEDQVWASGESGPGFRRIRSHSDQVFVCKSYPEEERKRLVECLMSALKNREKKNLSEPRRKKNFWFSRINVFLPTCRELRPEY
ncbi:hypothetical protein EYF80_065272 [Liparis tanakae]|uniref:Uncharacterized protein n=1 Tax=Liparis tanakae TaxID=230148 RepID=A0A4Z2E7I0_9TELE|nr:hypothetical protein EYF80_065272 [Liparis tanakae]